MDICNAWIDNREIKINAFLLRTWLNIIDRIKIPSDASFRKYERIITSSWVYILMDAPQPHEDVQPFIKIDNILLNLGLSAPKIILSDVENWFLLLEDLGNSKFNDLLIENWDLEIELYTSAVNVLIQINKDVEQYDLDFYDEQILIKEAMLMPEWYLPLFLKLDTNALENIKNEYNDIICSIISKLKLPNDVIVLRDYHVDNLLNLDDRIGIMQVWLLDFQDALMWNSAYDLVSLLQDARRDVSEETQQSMINYFLNNVNVNKDDFINDYHILGAQRNLKILGIFSRLKLRDSKEKYLSFIPRVKKYLEQDLQHPSLEQLYKFLKDKCNL